jgi:hypothetical protein
MTKEGVMVEIQDLGVRSDIVVATASITTNHHGHHFLRNRRMDRRPC